MNTLSIDFIINNVYPGDYSAYVEWDENDCMPCLGFHQIGSPAQQWNDDVLADPKREDNKKNKLQQSILHKGIKRAIRISAYGQHLIVINGHHRIYAALDAALLHVPVDITECPRTFFDKANPFKKHVRSLAKHK